MGSQRGGWRRNAARPYERVAGRARKEAKRGGRMRRFLQLALLKWPPSLYRPASAARILGNPILGNPILGNPILGNPILGNPRVACSSAVPCDGPIGA
jgi:hypothetical protein